jgi:hypothetical protein
MKGPNLSLEGDVLSVIQGVRARQASHGTNMDAYTKSPTSSMSSIIGETAFMEVFQVVLHPPAVSCALAVLPPEIVTRVLSYLPGLEEIGACLRASRLFCEAWGTASARDALALWAHEAAERAEPPSSWSDSPQAWLVFCEHRRLAARRRGVVAAAANLSALVDGDGAAHTCGAEVKEAAILGRCVLGHGHLPANRLAAPTPVPALAGVKIRSVAASDMFTLALATDGRWAGPSLCCPALAPFAIPPNTNSRGHPM